MAQGQELDLKEIARRLQDSVVVLEVDMVGDTPTSTGTGFFISPEGYIATNHHVIEGAHSIVARTHGEAKYRIDAILADDEENDLAILRAEKGNYVPLALGHSSQVEVGDRVVVLGNPLGLDFTLSEGIVSAIRGRDELKDPAMPHVQISAPISHGSSGSPVVNRSGEVVGIVASGFLGSQNLNFAVPVDLLRGLLKTADRDPRGTPLGTRWTVTARNVGLSLVFFVAVFALYKYFA